MAYFLVGGRGDSFQKHRPGLQPFILTEGE